MLVPISAMIPTAVRTAIPFPFIPAPPTIVLRAFRSFFRLLQELIQSKGIGLSVVVDAVIVDRFGGVLLKLHRADALNGPIHAGELLVRDEAAGLDGRLNVAPVDVTVPGLGGTVDALANVLLRPPGLVVDIVRVVFACVETTVHA